MGNKVCCCRDEGSLGNRMEERKGITKKRNLKQGSSGSGMSRQVSRMNRSELSNKSEDDEYFMQEPSKILAEAR